MHGICWKIRHIFDTELLQVDSLATSRDSDLHEATRRLLSVLLRQVCCVHNIYSWGQITMTMLLVLVD